MMVYAAFIQLNKRTLNKWKAEGDAHKMLMDNATTWNMHDLSIQGWVFYNFHLPQRAIKTHESKTYHIALEVS